MRSTISRCSNLTTSITFLPTLNEQRQLQIIDGISAITFRNIYSTSLKYFRTALTKNKIFYCAGRTSVNTTVSSRCFKTLANGVLPVGDNESLNALSFPAPDTRTQVFRAAAITWYPTVTLRGGGFTAVTDRYTSGLSIAASDSPGKSDAT
jgi:hypothetical protein